MRKDIAIGTGVAGAALLGAAAIYYFREKATEQPDYRVLQSEDDFEIRSYPEVRVAETIVEGPRKQALKQGFRVLADYFFAKSRDGEELEMTVPVMQDSGNPGASDPPLYDDMLEGRWRVRFVIPEENLDNPPDPPEDVEIVAMPPRRVGAVRFSGVADDDRLVQHEDRLRGWLSRQGEKAAAQPEYAFYNSPMIPPPLRRSEVLIPLD